MLVGAARCAAQQAAAVFKAASPAIGLHNMGSLSRQASSQHLPNLLPRCQEGRASGGGGLAVDRSLSSLESAAAAEALAAADEDELPTTLSSDDEGVTSGAAGCMVVVQAVARACQADGV